MEMTSLVAEVLLMPQKLSPIESEQKINLEHNNFVDVSATDPLSSWFTPMS